MKIVKLKNSGRVGILMIEAKHYQSYSSLCNIMLEDGKNVAVGEDDYEVISEIEEDSDDEVPE